MQSLERRRNETRTPHRVPCRLRILSDEDTVLLAGRTINISQRGLSVQVPHSIPEGARVEALVPVLHGDPMRIQGMVIHSRRVMADTFELGIRLEHDETSPN